MKRTLRASVIANVALASVTFYLARQARVAGLTPRQPPEAPHAAAATPATPQRSQRESMPFQWSQLESTDYRTYVSNLRSIGCPEQTLRDIIVADVHNLYAPRREALKRKRTGQEHAAEGTRLFSRQPVDAELQSLRNEETTLVALLLGTQSNGPDASRISPSRTLRDRSRDGVVAIPLVLQNVDSSEITLNDRQTEVIEELRRKFQDDLGDSSQDPYDPAYRKRWQEAQRESDNLLAGMLGGQFYLDYQLAATNVTSGTE